MRQKKLHHQIQTRPVKQEVKEEVFDDCSNQMNTENSESPTIVEPAPKSNMENISSIFLSQPNLEIPGLDLTDQPNAESNENPHNAKATSNSSVTVNKLPNINTENPPLAESISKLIENPQVLALLSLVGLTNAAPTASQTEALKPITDALAKITGRDVNDIMKGLQSASSIGLNHGTFEKEPEPNVDPNVHIAASGIVVQPQWQEQNFRNYPPNYRHPSQHNFDQPQNNYNETVVGLDFLNS